MPPPLPPLGWGWAQPAGRGWCGFHFQLATHLARTAGRASSVALLYGDVLAAAVRSDWRQPAHCDVCELSVLAARRAAEQLADALQRDALDEAFKRAGAACLTHLPILAALPAGRGRDRLLEPALANLAALARDLADYARRQSYDYHGDKGDQGALRRLDTAVRGTWGGTAANQRRTTAGPRPWYRRLLG
jgi:hypothetical protein